MRSALFATLCAVVVAGCSSGQKKTTPELGRYEGKKVALISIEAEQTSRKIVEVALVNQLIQRGSFILVPKEDVEAARAAPEQDPMDWRGIARRAGADVAMRAKVLQFDAVTNEGYSREIVEDSQLKAERGEKGAKAERLYKVKSLTGSVQVLLEFTELSPEADGEIKSAVAEAKSQVVAEARTQAAHLPPRMRFLETLTNDAFKTFFERYE